MLRKSPLLVLLCSAFITATANAGIIIGVNFTAGTADLMTPTDQPGVVAGANWNNETVATGTNVPLHDSNGNPTTALISYTSTGAFSGFPGTNTPNAATNTMYKGRLTDSVITLSNIPYSSYDLYVYDSPGTRIKNTMSVSDGTTTYYFVSNGNLDRDATKLTQVTSTDPNNPSSGEGFYEFFTETSSSVTLTTGGQIPGGPANHMFGLEIVDTGAAVPEPSSFLLLGMTALVGLCGWRLTRRLMAAC